MPKYRIQSVRIYGTGVRLKPEEVHSLVLWSKNFQPFLESEISKNESYRWYFNFSLVDCPEWEPFVPPIEKRLNQLKEICQRWSPRQVNWRFDPIVLWDDGWKDNLHSFQSIADLCAKLAIPRCTVSFVTWYAKVKKRVALAGLNFFDPPMEQKLEIIDRMSRICIERYIRLESCCNEELLQNPGISRGSCVNGAVLSELAGEPCSQTRDTGQRSGCGCTKSSDIGSYAMTCPHGCVYCYAKPLTGKLFPAK